MQGFTSNTKHEVTIKRRKRRKAYVKAHQKEAKDNRSSLTLDFKQLKSYLKGKHSASKKFQSLAMRGKNC